MQLAAPRLRPGQFLGQLVALPRDLLRASLQLLLLGGCLLQPRRKLRPPPLEIDQVRPVIRELGEDADRLVALPFHRMLGVVDLLERGLQGFLGVPLLRLVLGGGVGELLLLDPQLLFLAAEMRQAHSQQRHFLPVLRLPAGDGLALPLRELHLLLGEAQLLVDAVRVLRQLLHLLLVLEQVEPLRGEAGFQARGMRERHLLRLAGLVQLVRLRRLGLAQAGVLAAGREQLELAQLAAQLAEFLGLLRRALERLQPLAHLSDDVGKPEQVLLGGLELSFRLLAPRLVLGDSGRLLDERPPVLGLGADDEADAALLDDRVRARADTGPKEKLGDVQEPAGRPVDLVLAVAVAEQAPGDRDLSESGVLRRHQPAVVLEGQRDLRHPGRGPRLGPGEDHVLHRAAAQVLRALLAHRPADRVHHIALSAAVGAHHAGDAVVEGEDYTVGEGLEAGDLQAPDFHRTAGQHDRPRFSSLILLRQLCFYGRER